MDQRVLVSAHRCGYAELGQDAAHEDPLAGLAHAAAVGADYVEFDVRRCSDGTFVVAHDPESGPLDDPAEIRRTSWEELHARAPQIVLLTDLLEALAATRVGAHVDVKFGTPTKVREAGHAWEHDLLDLLTSRLDPERIIMTTGRGDATQAMRDWVDAHGIQVRIGLSVGASLRGLPFRQALAKLYGQVFPRLRYETSGADAVAAHYALAMLRISRWTTRIGVPLLVWTVDDRRLQRRLLRDRRVWMITTNWPARAFAIRESLGG